MPANFILNQETLPDALASSSIMPPAFVYALSALKFENVMLGNKLMSSYKMITYHGKQLAMIGAAPDKCRELSSEPLKQFYQHNNIKRIYCLDQRRNQCLDPNLNHKITVDLNKTSPLKWSELHRYEQTLNIKIYNAYNNIRFDLADLFELNLAEFNNQEKIAFHANLSGSKPTTVGQLKLPNSSKHNKLKSDLYKSHSSAEHYGDEKNIEAQQFINQLRLYPSTSEINAFINSMNEAHLTNELPLIYCAGGSGRTSLYIVFWLQYVTKCSLNDAVKYVTKHYKPHALNEVIGFLSNMKHQLSQACQNTLTHYANTPTSFWHNRTLNQLKKAMANELLSQPSITHQMIINHIKNIRALNIRFWKKPESGRLFTILHCVADEIGLSRAELSCIVC